MTTSTDALEILRDLTGRADAQFHDGQAEAITALVDDRSTALVVQRTGWGKSAVYFVATALLRRRGAGPTLLVSPLLALMRDQVSAAERAGVRAAAINSASVAEWDEIDARLAADEIDVLLISPERLNSPGFRETHLPRLIETMGLFVVDEAHCISDWGHDFRPDYRRLAHLIAEVGDRVPVLATTATANERVVADVSEQLGAARGMEVVAIRGTLARDSLRLGVLQLADSRQRLGWLRAHLGDLTGSGIIYALTISAAEDTAAMLRDAGYEVAAYTGRTDADERLRLENSLKNNELKALVATSALGMGFDKPDLGFVIHFGAPSSPVSYYQQVGRAGRATDSADVLLLPGHEDRQIWEYFATASMPDPDKAEAVLAALGSEPISTVALEAVVDIRRTSLELLLKVLDVDGAAQRVRGGWVGTGQPWVYDAERYSRIAAARQSEQQMMLDYIAATTCRMALLQSALDDPHARPCGRCDVCAGPWYSTEVPAEAVAAADETLERTGVAIEPRAQWPSGLDRRGISVKGRIRPEERPAPGRAIARLTDIGWGTTLRELLGVSTPDQTMPATLEPAIIATLRDWSWDERPTAVVAMPSLTRPILIESTARRISELGRLDFLGLLDVDPTIPRVGPGGNSAFRLASVWGRFTVSPELREALATHSGPVLLVDDLVDSRWTMTVAARELLMSGASSVLPFSLATVA